MSFVHCPLSTVHCPLSIVNFFAMPHHEMLIIKRAYDFSKWLLCHTGKFPKSYRFSIAVRLENAVLEFTELLGVANKFWSRPGMQSPSSAIEHFFHLL